MHFIQASSATAVILGLLATVSQAKINLGNDLNNNLMWLEGDSACTARVTSKIGENPCGRPVRLANNRVYSVNGCGGTLYILNEDGTFNSQCKSVVTDTACGVHRTYQC